MNRFAQIAWACLVVVPVLVACSSEDDDDGGCVDVSGTWVVNNQCDGIQETCTVTQDGCDAQRVCDVTGTMAMGVSGSEVTLYPELGVVCKGTVSADTIDGQCETDDGTCLWSATREGGGSGTGPLDWHTSSCADLGGTLTAAGACYIGCGSSSQCPVDELSCGAGYQMMCQVNGCSTDANCGPQGWVCESWGGCYMRCTTVTSGAQSAECPTGWSCEEDPKMYRAPHCVGN